MDATVELMEARDGHRGRTAALGRSRCRCHGNFGIELIALIGNRSEMQVQTLPCLPDM